jgi:hypothetical protein
MDFNLKIYTLIESNILYVHVFFLNFFKSFKLEVLKFEKRKKKIGLHVARATLDVKYF